MFELMINPDHDSINELVLAFFHALVTYSLPVVILVYSLLDVPSSSRGIKPLKAIATFSAETESHNTSRFLRDNIAIDRADRQPSAKPYSYWNFESAAKPIYKPFTAVRSVDDGSSQNESTAGTSGYVSGTNYSENSHKAQIAIAVSSYNETSRTPTRTSQDSHRRINLVRSNFKGEASVPDKADNLCVKQGTVLDAYGIRKSHDNHDYSRQTTETKPSAGLNKPVHFDSQNATPGKSTDNVVASNDSLQASTQGDRAASVHKGYNKLTYAVLIAGNTVKVYNTSMASFPHYDKFMVKEKHKDSSGAVKTKLTLKSSQISR